VGGGLGFIVYLKNYSNEFQEHQLIEFLWTLFPGVILIFLAIPSLKTLYFLDESIFRFLTLKILGHQWYWSYEYSDFKDFSFDSYIVPTNDLKIGQFRLLESSNVLILPMKIITRLLISSTDVIHSWTIPRIGVKVDAMPGRLNQAFCFPLFSGNFYGQCSEICGTLHSFIPIKLEVVSLKIFLTFLK